MNKHEIEVKILEINKEAIISTLEKAGAIKLFEGLVKTEHYKNTEGHKLRLRELGNITQLAHKEHIENSQVKDNIETEITLDDAHKFRTILNKIGFTLITKSQKNRISYQLNDIHFDIDTLNPIPTFIEVEAETKEKVIAGVELLGYKIEQTVTFTERTLKEYYGIN